VTTDGAVRMTENIGDKAVKLFASGFNCSESVLLALSRELNEPTEHIIPCIATGFGGGIARTGSTCGALSGAIMTIGLIVGRNKSNELEKKEIVYEMAFKMITDFEREFGTSLCKNLIKCDLRTPKGHEKVRSQKIKETVCTKFVEWSANYVTRLIESR
jgi:C_GCAxxG_C_C family probable redox protein